MRDIRVVIVWEGSIVVDIRVEVCVVDSGFSGDTLSAATSSDGDALSIGAFDSDVDVNAARWVS